MSGDAAIPWLALLLLGMGHGVNPAMGWLFAVARGLQEQRGRAVWRALLPLAAGHALAICAVVLLAALVGLLIPLAHLRWLVALIMLGVGIRHLLRPRHPRWGGMRMGAGELTVWSLLMASAHGAGLMVLPFLLPDASPSEATAAMIPFHSHPGAEVSMPLVSAPSPFAEGYSPPVTSASVLRALGVLAALIHTGGYLLATGSIAVVVYQRIGLRVLRSAWVNFDLIWAAALILTALLTLLL